MDARPTPRFESTFSSTELQAIRVGELDLRALRERQRSLFPILRPNPPRLSNDRLEALRRVVITAGSDFTGVTLLDAYRCAAAAGIQAFKLDALVDAYWD